MPEGDYRGKDGQEELSKDQRPDATELPAAAVPLVARVLSPWAVLTLLFLAIIKPGGFVAGPLFR